MDILSKILRPSRAPPGARTVNDQGTAWPKIRAVDGKYYVFTDMHQTEMVAQTRTTWEQLGTIMEQQRRTLAGQDGAIKAQSNEIHRLNALLNETTEKLTHLRENHRVLLRERIEGAPAPSTNPVINIFATPKKD